MKTFIILSVCLLSLCFRANAAQPPKSVKIRGTYTYFVPENVSMEQARNTAIERARLEALAKEFGTSVSQINTVSISSHNEESQTGFRSIGRTEVKGEWLSDIEEPKIEISYQDNQLIITASVYGKARRRGNADFDLLVKTLRNGIESETFKNNDRFSIGFKSPVNGYLSVYLLDDEAGTAYCLVPYENGNGKAREIKGNTDYRLLCTEDPLYPYDEETILTCKGDMEHNRLVIIFSENGFIMPITETGEYVPQLSSDDFSEWLYRNRMRDPDLQIMEKIVEIRNENN